MVETRSGMADPPSKVNDSILTSIKKAIGFEKDYDHFDQDIIMHINTAFSTLYQLKVGSATPFIIRDDTATWDKFILENAQEAVRSYVYVCVRLGFDPPETSYARTSLEKVKTELEWRLNIAAESETL